ncbi:hypothetical protein ACFQS2_10945 [Brachybacterium sp. GCM10030267]
MGVLAGAVGSSFESDESVRQVAYGQREKYRLRSIGDSTESPAEMARAE